MEDLTRLANRARAGDQRALELLVEVAYEQVWRFCASLVDEQGAEDLAQETFLRAVRALPRYRADAAARTWLLSIAQHVCMDELRSRIRRRHRDQALPAGTPGAEHAVADVSEHAVVADLLRRIEPDRRAAFVLTQMLGLSYEEAAQVCECPVGTIRSRVPRARADLLQLLDGLAGIHRHPRRRGSSSS